MDLNGDIPALLAELDALREARGLSYQDVADACQVGKATVYRALTGATGEPSLQLVQKIAAAVQYKPNVPAPELTDLSKDGYIAYLKAALQHQSEENDMRVQQLHAHYNRLRAQDRRTIRMVSLALALLIAAFIIWLIIDVTHPTVGWFQREVANQSGAMHTVTDWLEENIWSV